MKKTFTTLALIAIAVLAITAGRKFNNASDAAVNCPTISNYINKGFTVDEVFPNSYRYVAEPTGTYDWGTVTVKMHARTGGEYSLETTYVTVTCYVRATEKGNNVSYSVTGDDVYETVVY